MASKQTPITDDQRRVLEMDRDHPDATPKDIFGMLDDPHLTVDYVQSVIHNFELDDEKPENPVKAAIMSSATTNNDADEDDETDEQFEPDQSTRPLKSLGEKSREVIEEVQADPDVGFHELAERFDTSDAHVKGSLQKFAQMTDPDAAVWETIKNPRDTKNVEDITGDKARTVVETINDHPTWEKGKVADVSDCQKSYVTSTMQKYDHLLSDRWCARFPSLSGGETLPRGNGDDASHDKGGPKKHTTPDVGEDEDEEDEDELEAEPEVDENNPNGFDPADERRRIENLHDIGLLDDDEFDERIEALVEKAGGEEVEPDEDEGGDGVVVKPELARGEKGQSKRHADILPESEMVVDTDKLDILENELERLTFAGGELGAYGEGIRHALNVLGIDTQDR